MKPVLVPLLLSSFLFLSTFAAAAFDPVLDSDGNKLKRGAEYYILPNPGIGGGLTLASRNETCPLYVSKESSEVSPGLPVTIFPFDHRENTVRLSSDANFVFSAASICVQSTVWRLGETDEATGRSYVTTGGLVGRTGPKARSNWFMIERFEDKGGYKLVSCPQPPVCVGCGKPRCGDLGLFAEGRRAWLGFGGSPFPVMFRKA